MRPHQARRLATGLWAGSFLMGILSLTLTLYLLVEWYFAKPLKASTTVSVAPLRLRPVVKQPTLEEYKTIASVPILEDTPTVAPVVVKPPVKPADTPSVALPLIWVGVAVHSSPKKSVAFVLDKRSNKQILLREGTQLPDSPWKVVQITTQALLLQAGEAKAVVEKPKPVQITAPSQPQKIVVPGNGSLSHEIVPPSEDRPATEEQPFLENQVTEERE